jgi:hypothetical protein
MKAVTAAGEADTTEKTAIAARVTGVTITADPIGETSIADTVAEVIGGTTGEATVTGGMIEAMAPRDAFRPA